MNIEMMEERRRLISLARLRCAREARLECLSSLGDTLSLCIVKDAEVKTPMVRQSLLGAAVDGTSVCISDNCALDDSTLQPSPLCVLGNCISNLANCLFSSAAAMA